MSRPTLEISVFGKGGALRSGGAGFGIQLGCLPGQPPCLQYVSQKASRYSAGTRVNRSLKHLSPVSGRCEAPRESGHHQHLVI